MSGFSADWLALREPADRSARAAHVLEACRVHFAGRESLTVCDLGAGTGAAVRAFGPLLPPAQRWLLVDNEALNLEEAKRRYPPGSVVLETRVADLAADPSAWPTGCGLVTATALFDLASPAWIERFCARLAADRLPLLATLTYDGQQVFIPAHPADAEMLTAFNRHQRLDKGLGGPAAGPEGTVLLVKELAARGYAVTQAPSPWRLDGNRDRTLIAETLQGWAAAVAAAGLVAPAAADAWLDTRLARTDALTVGHTDLFAAPA